MFRRIRVLYLIDGLGMGGAEAGLVLTLRTLDRRFETEVAVLGRGNGRAGDVGRLGVPLHRLGTAASPASLLAIPRVVRLLRQGRFDIVHTTLVWSSIVGRVAGRIARVRVVSHIANAAPGPQAPAPSLPERSVAWLDNLTGRLFVDRFVAISEAARRRPIRGPSWDPSKTVVVLRGQDLEDLAHRASLEPQPPLEDPGSPSILTVGRLAPQKGTRVLIEAMPGVLRVYPNARLLIAGDGKLRSQLERLAAPLGDRVAFLGIRHDVPALLARADVFAFPSLWEGQGNALLEAMAVGGPIVATTIPAVEETLRDGVTGVLVDAADPEAMAAGVVRLLEDPARSQEMAARAAHEAARFDIHATTRRLEAVYEELMT